MIGKFAVSQKICFLILILCETAQNKAWLDLGQNLQVLEQPHQTLDFKFWILDFGIEYSCIPLFKNV